MNDVLPDLQTWIDRGDRIAIATVVSVKKSAPRPPGAKMAVNEDGEVIGAVSGGCVEGAVIEIADSVLRGEPPRLVHFGIADETAWDVGLPCGGEIDVWVQEYSPGRFTEIAAAGGRAAEITMLEGDEPGRKVLFEEDGTQSGSLGSADAGRGGPAGRRGPAVARDLGAARADVRRRGGAGAAADPVRRGSDRGGAVPDRARHRVALLRRRSADPVRDAGALPGRRAGDRRLAEGGVRAAGRDRPRDLDRRC